MLFRLFGYLVLVALTGVLLALPGISPRPLPFMTQRDYSQTFARAEVLAILEEGEREIGTQRSLYQIVRLRVADGPEAGQILTVEYGGRFKILPEQKVTPGQSVVLSRTMDQTGQVAYAISDRYRLDALWLIAVGVLVLIAFVAWRKSFGSILGMLLSLAVILKFVAPLILNGYDPLLVTIGFAMLILVVTTYLAHGLSIKTSVAVLSTFVALVLTGLFSALFMSWTHVLGLGDEELVSLRLGETGVGSLPGLFFSALIIGALGALNDLTTTQSATVFELHEVNPRLGFVGLFTRGMLVGREHVVSLVNTLVLAYAGSAFGLFILIVLNPSGLPFWVIINSEVISDELIRMLAGSAGLTLAVPITTALAAAFASLRGWPAAREDATDYAAPDGYRQPHHGVTAARPADRPARTSRSLRG